MTAKLFSKALYKLPNLFWPLHNLKEYALILDTAINSGYHFVTLGELNAGSTCSDRPFMILRHDIDTHPEGALRFAEIEESRGIRATYFFRISTWHPQLQNLLNRRGHEVGYHFEELSAYAVKNHLKDKQRVLQQLPQIKADFISNLSQLRLSVDFEIKAFAAHGDFTYRTLDLGNRLFMKDDTLRKDCGIAYEAYDEALVTAYQNHISDKPAPQNFYPFSPLNCIARQEHLLFLTHPRWWIANPIGNLRSDWKGYYRQLRW